MNEYYNLKLDACFSNELADILNKHKALSHLDLDKILCWSNNDTRWWNYVQLVKSGRCTEFAINKGFNDAYTTGKISSFEECVCFEDLLDKIRFEKVSDAYGLKLYKKLPNIINVYRGTSVDEFERYNECADLVGFSWTIDIGVAEFFAFRFNQPDRLVMKASIPKQNIKAIFTQRKEYEVLIKPDTFDSCEIRIQTKKPTAYYDKFMKEHKKRQKT